jgi:hypothetical protein
MFIYDLDIGGSWIVGEKYLDRLSFNELGDAHFAKAEIFSGLASMKGVQKNL